jgi:hypothetical protein
MKDAIVCLQCGRPVLTEHTYGDAMIGYLKSVHYSCRVCMLDRESRLTRDGVWHESYGTKEVIWQEVPQGCLAVFSWEQV